MSEDSQLLGNQNKSYEISREERRSVMGGELFKSFYTECDEDEDVQKGLVQRMFSKMTYGGIRASVFNMCAAAIGAGIYIYIYIYI